MQAIRKEIRKMKGIDISTYQNGLKMADVKAAGYEYVIIRAGYTGYGANRTKAKDKCFEGFYKDAKANGLNVGAYWYSCANNAATGKAEAEHMYNNCLKGKSFEMPIYIDVENPQWQQKDKKGTTDAIIAFCEYLEDKGYYVGVYASSYWFNSIIDTGRLSGYTKWVAAWSSKKPDFKYNAFDMWQNSDNGRIGSMRIDTDICYQDFPNIIKAAGKNGLSSASGSTGSEAAVKKTVDELAQEVMDGKWGNGEERKEKIKAAGYDYDAVQDRVNEIYAAKTTKTYTVQKGDTLTKIAKKYDTTVAKLKTANNIKDANKIYTGQVLKIV